MDASEFGYFAKQVANDLEITTSTLRRWSIELEKHGYEFERNDKEQRIYHERDFKAFREMKSLISNNVGIVDACKSVVARFRDVMNAPRTLSVQTQLTRDLMREMVSNELSEIKKELQDQRNFNKLLLEKLEQQQAYYEGKFEELLHDKTLLFSLKESMQQRKLESAENEDKVNEQLKGIERQLSGIQQKQDDNEVIKELSEQIAGLNRQFKQMQETIKETATTQQEKKGFFSRLFNK
jgi:chromosome segregation ATPase